MINYQLSIIWNQPKSKACNKMAVVLSWCHHHLTCGQGSRCKPQHPESETVLTLSGGWDCDTRQMARSLLSSFKYEEDLFLPLSKFWIPELYKCSDSSFIIIVEYKLLHGSVNTCNTSICLFRSEGGFFFGGVISRCVCRVSAPALHRPRLLPVSTGRGTRSLPVCPQDLHQTLQPW